ncbi:hypothetical protein [Streptomyces sp. NPDC048057]|uniref:hypothetical protein n=1 Tax=Streptomyces sp. NPDC048057 TaxID=3155628 RepID=UPI0033ECBDB8
MVAAAGTALIAAMATDTWQQTRTAVLRLWRRARPEQTGSVEDDLEAARQGVLAARTDGDTDTEQALAGQWRLRFQQLVRESPELAAELRRLLDDDLTPALSADERSDIASIVMQARADRGGRVYQAGRDQHISETFHDGT